MFWRSGVIRRVYTLLKAAKRRGVMKVVDDTINAAKQLERMLLNGKVELKVLYRFEAFVGIDREFESGGGEGIETVCGLFEAMP